MDKIYIGADNGVTATIGAINMDATFSECIKVPTFSNQDYTKAKKNITRIDIKKLFGILSEWQEKGSLVAILERPMVNPTRFVATCSALRALEAELVILELLDIPIIYLDSKEWQREMLPKGIVGADNLKKASLDVGNRLFPQFKELKHPDRDGILIAEYARRKRLL